MVAAAQPREFVEAGVVGVFPAGDVVDFQPVPRRAAGDLAVVAAGVQGGALMFGDAAPEVGDGADVDPVADHHRSERLGQQRPHGGDRDGPDAGDLTALPGLGVTAGQRSRVDVDDDAGFTAGRLADHMPRIGTHHLPLPCTRPAPVSASVSVAVAVSVSLSASGVVVLVPWRTWAPAVTRLSRASAA